MLKNLMKYCGLPFLLFSMFASCENEEKYDWKPIDVEVSAYNSVPSQTDDSPFIGAWGDSLTKRQKSIAISRDLMALGFKHNTKVMIEGLPGVYLVKDKMAARWSKRIDIYMGDNVKKAKKWGVKKLSIVYSVEKEKLSEPESN